MKYDGEPLLGLNVSDGFHVANSFYVKVQNYEISAIYLDEVTFSVVSLYYPPFAMSYKVYEDNDDEIGELLYENNFVDEVTYMGLLWNTYDMYEVKFLDESEFDLRQATDETRHYWIELHSEESGVFWVSHLFDYEEGWPAKMDNGQGWETYTTNDGELLKGTFNMNFRIGILGTLESHHPELSYYPNPTTDYLHLNSPLKIKSAEVYDLNGKSLGLNSGIIQNNRMDVSNLPNGIYMLKVTFENGKTDMIKFIKK